MVWGQQPRGATTGAMALAIAVAAVLAPARAAAEWRGSLGRWQTGGHGPGLTVG
jgi:hypothetical protein